MTDQPHDPVEPPVPEDQFVVLPPEGDGARLPLLPKPIELPDGDPPNQWQQFSLAGMFVLMLLGALVSMVASYVPLRVFTGVVGLVSLVTLGLLSMIRPKAALAHVAWWLLLVMYLTAAGVAVYRGE